MRSSATWHPLLRPHAARARSAERTARAARPGHGRCMRRPRGRALQRDHAQVVRAGPRSVPTFLERHGVTGAFVAESAFLRGLGKALGLEPVDAPRRTTRSPTCAGASRSRASGSTPATRSSSATRRRPTPPGTRRTRRIKQRHDRAARRRSRRPADGPRDRLHHRRPRDARFARRDPLGRPGAACSSPGPACAADAVTASASSTVAAGILGQLRGPDLMPVLLNAADRPLFLGSRPTPFDGADGYPALLEPLL